MPDKRPASDIKAALTGSVFTFLVGEELEQFDVHPNIISGLSKPLAALMNNGQMKESLKRTAKLPETEPATFAMFLEYAYQGSYTIATPQGTLHAVSNGATSWSHHCGYCGKDQPRQSPSKKCEYLFCQAARHRSIGLMFCPSCGEDRISCIRGPRCWTPANTPTARSLGFLRRTYQTRRIQHPINPAEAEQLSPHAKLYLLADQYMVDGLKVACLNQLHKNLCFLKLDDHTIEEVVDLVRLVIAQAGEGDLDLSRLDPLQDLVMDYIDFEARNLVDYKQFRRDCMDIGGPFMTEFAARSILLRPGVGDW